MLSSTTGELLAVLPLVDIDADEVRRLWRLPPNVPIGSQPVGNDEWPFVRQHLGDGDVPGGDVEAFVELTQDFPGEAIREADGTTWYPPP